MNTFGFPQQCVAPRLAEFVTPYCFGDISQVEREAFEQHLLECDYCWTEVQRLADCVKVLRSDPSVTSTVSAGELIGALGLSGRLDERFAGHFKHVLLVSTAFALFFAVAVFVELAYQFDRFGQLATLLASLTWLWIFVTSLIACRVDTKGAQSGGALTVARPLAVLFSSTVLLCGVMMVILPSTPTVVAAFQTFPVTLGFLKAVFFAWLFGLPFLFWPLHFVLSMQRELASGRHRGVLKLLTHSQEALPPRDTPYVRVWVLFVFLAALSLLNYASVSHLFDNLLPGAYKTLFMALVMLRITILFGSSALGLWWYARALTELKREAFAMQTFAEPESTPHRSVQ